METSEETMRRAAAYHEAGHAVVAMDCGWWISPEGVWIEGCEGYCGHRIPLDDLGRDNPRAVVSLAGWLSEYYWHGRGRESYFDNDSYLVECTDCIGAGPGEPEDEEDEPDDAEAVVIHLKGLHPELDDHEIIALCRKYESEAKGLVAKLWPSIERLAGELILKGKLSAVEAHMAAGL